MTARAARSPRVFTIPASVPFLPALVEALVAGKLVPGLAAASDPLALTAATLFLPTRRPSAGGRKPGGGARARRRSRAPDGRHRDPRGGVGPARRAGPRPCRH